MATPDTILTVGTQIAKEPNKPTVLRVSKVSVCPECYEYVVSRQRFPVQDASNQLVLWHFYCPRCKKFVEPKLMDINERGFLNVNKLRRAKKAVK